MSIDRDRVLGELTAQMLIDHYQAEGRWFGRWFRSKWCPIMTHVSPAFGLSREGMWHCHACDRGGDLLHLVAAAESLDVRRDFGAVLELAAGIAGVPDEDDFGGQPAPPPRRARPERDREAELQRVSIARLRAKWLWLRLGHDARGAAAGRDYLARRGLPIEALAALGEPISFTPSAINPAEVHGRDELKKTRGMFYPAAVCLPVRSVVDDAFVDVRTRRLEPREGEPKILGMPGGVTSLEGELVGCYGRPASLGLGDVYVVEGWADYLAARLAWPDEDILGAVDAGQIRTVAAFAAAHCAKMGSKLVIFAHDDAGVEAGPVGVDRATTAALRCGLQPQDVIVVECRSALGCKDLAELMPHHGGVDEAREAVARLLGGA